MFPKNMKNSAEGPQDETPIESELEDHDPVDDHADHDSQPRSCSYVGPGMHIKGEIVVDESLNIDGKVEGTITSEKKKLAVGTQGHVDAEVRAKCIEARGKMNGVIHGEDVVHLYSTAVVKGTIHCARFIVDDGAVFEGSISMLGEAGQKSEKRKLKLASSNDIEKEKAAS